MSKHTITVLPATESDTLALATVESLAFDAPPPARFTGANPDDPAPPTIGRIMFGAPSAARNALRAREHAAKLDLPETRLYKAVVRPEGQAGEEGEEGEEKVVGFASWKFFTTPFPKHDTWTDQAWENAANPAACNAFFGGLERLRTKHMGGRTFALLAILAIHPAYQGSGIGGKLLRRGLDDAAALGLTEAFLEATEAGRPLYAKFGWREVESFPLDLAPFGGEGVWRTFAMRRLPSST